MDADVLTTRVVDGIAVITLGTERRIYIDQETSDRHLSSFTPESLAYIKRLVRARDRDAPRAQGLLLERRLFMKLCLSDAALSRMRAYDEQDSDSPSRVT